MKYKYANNINNIKLRYIVDLTKLKKPNFGVRDICNNLEIPFNSYHKLLRGDNRVSDDMVKLLFKRLYEME